MEELDPVEEKLDEEEETPESETDDVVTPPTE